MSGYKKQASYNNKVPWNVFDVLGIFLTIFAISTVLYLFLNAYFKDRGAIYKVFLSVYPLLTSIVPYTWLTIRYRISINRIGLRTGRYSHRKSVLLGFLTAFFFLVVMRIIPFWYDILLQMDVENFQSFATPLFILITFKGIIKFVATPLGEEILLRGVLYGYLRDKIGVNNGIFLQAIISTALHTFFLKMAFQGDYIISALSYMLLIHIALGILYQKSDSLTSSIVCHGMFNYLLFIYARL